MGETVVSEDGKSTKATFTIDPPGVYDPELQLSGEQIGTMKHEFRNNPALVGKVATHIVDGLLPSSLLEEDDPWFDDAEDLETFKTATREHWFELLGHLVELPGSEWPEGVTPPATFAMALKELDNLEAEGRSNG